MKTAFKVLTRADLSLLKTHRSLSKQRAFRLEPIHDPAEDPGRYDKLSENDFALVAFDGRERPQAVTLILVSSVEDAELHATLADRFEAHTANAARAVSEAAVAHLRANTIGAYPHAQHPLDALISPDTLEEVLFTTGVTSPSPTEVRQQLDAAEETRQRGEELFGVWLTTTGHPEEDFVWVSYNHACSPFDYEVYTARWLNAAPHVFVTVKTTRGPFEQPLHMSRAELHFAARTENQRIARVYKVDGETPKLRILTGVQAVAARIVESLDVLPDGVTADSLQIDPGVFEVELETPLESGSDDAFLISGLRSDDRTSDVERKGPVQL